jgi:two-component system, sensor histidine kinase and response regulator
MHTDDAVDWSETLRSVGGNRALLATVVEAALIEIPRLMESITQAIAGRDATKLRLAAHTLKGSIRYFGAGPAFELAYQLELAGQAGRLDDGPALFAQLQSQVARITAVLVGYQDVSRQGCEAAGREFTEREFTEKLPGSSPRPSGNPPA